MPFVTGSYTNTGGSNNVQNPFQTIERQNVGITLKVTPQVNEGDSVVLDIVEVSSLATQILTTADVVTNERKVETKVLAYMATLWYSVVWLRMMSRTVSKVCRYCRISAWQAVSQ